MLTYLINLKIYKKSESCLCNSIVVFTTYWKFLCCCIHCLFGVNECQQPVYTHTFPFYFNFILINDSNDSTISITFLLTLCTIHEYNDVSEFIHSNWITLSYYSSPTHKSLIPKYLIHFFHCNLEHGLAILTESFSPLRSVLHNLSCSSPKQKSTSIDTQYNFLTSVALHNII